MVTNCVSCGSSEVYEEAVRTSQYSLRCNACQMCWREGIGFDALKRYVFVLPVVHPSLRSKVFNIPVRANKTAVFALSPMTDMQIPICEVQVGERAVFTVVEDPVAGSPSGGGMYRWYRIDDNKMVPLEVPVSRAGPEFDEKHIHAAKREREFLERLRDKTAALEW